MIDGTPAYGNTRGLDLLKNHTAMMRDIENMKKELQMQKEAQEQKYQVLQKELQMQKEALEQKYQVLQKDFQKLKYTSLGYIDIRLRFLATYRRDILKDPTATRTTNISKGNARAHFGDVTIDARLFREGKAVDNGLMEKIYEISASEVTELLNYNNQAAVAAIDDVATIKVRHKGKLPEKVRREWMSFLAILRGNMSINALDHLHSPTGEAFQSLMEAIHSDILD